MHKVSATSCRIALAHVVVHVHVHVAVLLQHSAPCNKLTQCIGLHVYVRTCMYVIMHTTIAIG